MAKAKTSVSVNPYTTVGMLSQIGSFLQVILASFLDFDTIDPETLKVSPAPLPDLGDYSFSCYQWAKLMDMAPEECARKLSEIATMQIARANQGQDAVVVTKTVASGPYLNIFVDRQAMINLTIALVLNQRDQYGTNSLLRGKTIMVEYLAPNTNKPLHMGHMRNGVIGTTLARLFGACGATVVKANNINDRGIHIAKSMLAYMLWGNNLTPGDTKEKGDHFVGRFYVMYCKEEARLKDEWLKANNIDLSSLKKPEQKKVTKRFEAECPFVQQAYALLTKWEAEDHEVMALWRNMNQWCYDGFDQTNTRLGFEFDRVYYESQTYKLGKNIVVDRFQHGVGQRSEKGIEIMLSEIGTKEPTLLLRADGTSVYMTQDVGLAVTRFNEIPGLTNVVYVVGSEQDHHFKCLFEVLRLYGFPWHSQLKHLSYGMVNLPEGKMKSREGTVVDADDLLSQLQAMVGNVIVQTNPDTCPVSVSKTSAEVALGALKYMLSSASPANSIEFDPKKSISFEGNTGPYLQYACVRIAAIEDRAKNLPPRAENESCEFTNEEVALAKQIALFGQAVSMAAADCDTSVLTSYLYDTAKTFSVFYTQCQVVFDGKTDLLRLKLCQATRQVLANGLQLLGIPIPDRM